MGAIAHTVVVPCGRRGCSGGVGPEGFISLGQGKAHAQWCRPCCSAAPRLSELLLLSPSSLDLFFRWLFDTHFLDEADIKFQ